MGGAAALLLAAVASAQTPPIPAPTDLLRAFDTRAGTVQELPLPASSDQPFSVRVVFGGVPRTLDLFPNDVRTRGFKLLVDDGVQLREVPTPPSVTFRGFVTGSRDSAVAASLFDGQLHALVLLDGQSWEVTPVTDAMPGLPRSAHIVFSGADLIGHDGFCGVDVAAGPLAAGAPEPDGTTGMDEAEVALDCDFQLYQRRGSSVTNVQNDVTNVMNATDLIYERDLNISLVVSTIIVRTTQVYFSTTTNLLSEFQNRWNQQHGSVQRDFAHLFSGKNNPGTVLGIANPSSVCLLGAGYAVSWTLSVASTQTRASLAGHEMGHNFSANHCNGAPECYIMCASLGGCGPAWKFAPISINRITGYAATRTCLRPPPPPVIPALTSVAPSTVPALRPPVITLTGTDLDTATQLTISGTPFANWSIVDPTTIQLTLPSGFDIADHPIVVSNAQGSSNEVQLTVAGTHPAVFEAPVIHAPGLTLPYFVWTDRQWNAMLFLSTSNTPSPLPGLVSFGIGNNFAELFYMATLAANTGGAAQIDLSTPTLSAPVTLYWQLVVFDPAVFPPPTPLEVSNVTFVTYF